MDQHEISNGGSSMLYLPIEVRVLQEKIICMRYSPSHPAAQHTFPLSHNGFQFPVTGLGNWYQYFAYRCSRVSGMDSPNISPMQEDLSELSLCLEWKGSEQKAPSNLERAPANIRSKSV